MDEWTGESETPHGPAARGPWKESAPGPLKAAIRRARVDEAERSDVLAELRGAEIARLEMLQDALQPVLAEIPADIDLFDVGLMPTDHPRLFIDMIGFIEMGRDRHLYRFLQDTKHGRVIVAESEKVEVLVKAITDYIARRLLEREKALAATIAASEAAAAQPVMPTPPPTPAKPRKSRQDFWQILGFTIDLLGSMALFTLLAAGCFYFLTLFASWSALLHHH